MNEQLEKIAKEIDKKKKDLQDLVLKGKFKLNPAELFNKKNESDSAQATFKSLPEDHLQKMIADTYQTEMELHDAQSLLDAKLAANQASLEASEQQAREDDGPLTARIHEEFLKEPAVAALAQEIEKVQNRLDHTKSVARQPNDPAARDAGKHLKNLNARYEILWKSKYKEIGQRLRVAAGSVHSPASIEELKLKIKMLTNHMERKTDNSPGRFGIQAE